MKELSLSGNNLQNLGFILRFLRTDTLRINKNRIQILKEEDFSTRNNILHLYLQKNRIQKIETTTFKPISIQLQTLDLSYNLITSVNGSIRYLSSLRLLILDYNLLQVKSIYNNVYIDLNKSIKLSNINAYLVFIYFWENIILFTLLINKFT